MAQSIVGLDIGTGAVRAVELSIGDGSRPELVAFGQVGLVPGSVVDGEVRDRASVARALERLWREGGFGERRVHVGVAGLRAITREIDMPVLPPNELDEAVRFRADEVIPFPMERTAIASRVIAQYTNAEGEPTLRVLIAAAHRDLIDSVVSTIIAAGLQPVGIDLDTAALVRALHDPAFDRGPEAIVSVGAGLTLVVIHQSGVLQFVRTIDIAGSTVTQSIASSLDLPPADAELIKRRLGDPAGEVDTRARSAAEQSVRELVTEVHNSLRYFSSLPGRSPIARVLVTGAGARTAGFLPALQHGLDVPVLPASPLTQVDASGLQISPDQVAAITPGLAVPIGLALPEPSGKPFNLLPPEVTAKEAERKAVRAAVAAAVVLLVILTGLSAWRVLSVRSKEKSVATLSAKIANIKTVQIPQYDRAVALKAQVASEQARLRPIVAHEIDWRIALNQVGQYLPSTATFTNLALQETTGSVTGQPKIAPGAAPPPTAIIGSVAGSVSVPSLADVTKFGQSMAGSPALLDVAATGTLAPGSKGTLSFQATMNLDGQTHSTRLSEFTQVLP